MVTWVESIRRFYRDLVKRRTSVRLMPASDAECGAVPIFLVGVFRSGTTLQRYVIDSHSQLCCPPETNFIRPLSELLSNRDNRTGLANMGFDEEHVVIKLRAFVSYFFANYARSVGKKRWADKSPGYVEFLDFIDRIFPNAQYLMIYRHGLDVAHSISRNGEHQPHYILPYMTEGGDARIAAAAYWSAQSLRMIEFQEKHAERCHVSRYELLCANPEPHLKELFEFLDEPWEPNVLQFNRFAHDAGAEDGRVRSTTGFSVSQGNYQTWPRPILEQAAQAAAPALTRLGYEVGLPVAEV